MSTFNFVLVLEGEWGSAQEQPEGSSARPLTDLALVCISQAWPLVPQR